MTHCKFLTMINTCNFIIYFRLDLREYQTKDQDAKYELFYSFKDIYKLKDMTVVGGMTELYHRMENDL